MPYWRISLSVKSVVNRLEPTRLIKLKAKQVDGVKNLRGFELIKENKEEPHEFNFLEGMGCLGGCVGGPRTVIDMESGTRYANQFGEDSVIMTPLIM